MEKQLLRRSCDWCHETQEFGPEQITPKDAERVKGWVILTRVFLVDDKPFPVQKHACKDSCAVNIVSQGMLDLPKEIKDLLEQRRQQQEAVQKKLAQIPRGATNLQPGPGQDSGDAIAKQMLDPSRPPDA